MYMSAVYISSVEHFKAGALKRCSLGEEVQRVNEDESGEETDANGTNSLVDPALYQLCVMLISSAHLEPINSS